jgi:hypothetical protein
LEYISQKVGKALKNGKVCMICDTPYQLLNCINIILNYKEYHISQIDLFVGRQFKNCDTFIERLKKEQLADHVYGYKCEKYTGLAQRYMYKIYETFHLSECIEAWINEDFRMEENKYGILFVSVYAVFQEAMRIACPNASVIFFDDGIGSYLDRVFPSRFSLRMIFCRLFRQPFPDLLPEYIYVNNPVLYKSRYVKNVKSLVKIDCLEKRHKELICRVFDYKSDDLYSKRIICLLQPNDRKYLSDEENDKKVMSLLEEWKEDCLVRFHPRMMNVEDPYLDFTSDRTGSLWELVCADQIMDRHILISRCSTSQFIPKMLFDKEPWLIFTCRLYEYVNKRDRRLRAKDEEMINRARDIYRNKEKIIVINSWREISSILQNILEDIQLQDCREK